MSEGREDRILTVPNLLTVARLLGVPVFLWVLFGRESRYAAAALLTALAVTDCLDGYIARHFNQVSSLGAVIDPTVDRILIGVAAVAVVVDGSVPTWLGLLLLVREGLVFLAAVGLVLMGARRVEVQFVGKAGSFALMAALPLFLAANPDGGAPWDDVARPLAWGFALVGVVLSWLAVATYIPPARDALAAARVGSGARGPRPAAFPESDKDGSP